MGVLDMVPPVISQQIKTAWTKVAADANEYAKALTQGTALDQCTWLDLPNSTQTRRFPSLRMRFAYTKWLLLLAVVLWSPLRIQG